MKNYFVATFATLTIALTVNGQSNVESNAIAGELAKQLISSFQKNSAESYVALLPSLEEVWDVMNANSNVYGNTIEEAKRTFKLEFTKKVLPRAKESFANLVREGNEKGVDWATAKLSSWDLINSPNGRPQSFEIIIFSRGKDHKIVVEKIFHVNGKLYIGPFIKLV